MIQTTERSNKRKIRTLSAFFVSFSPFRGARFTIRRNCGVRLGRRAKRKRGREKRKNIRRSEYSGVHPANFLSKTIRGKRMRDPFLAAASKNASFTNFVW